MNRQGTKTCRACKGTLPLTSFGQDLLGKLGLRATCKSCVNNRITTHKKANRARIRAREVALYRVNSDVTCLRARNKRLRKHGLSVDQFLDMLEAQCDCCAACGRKFFYTSKKDWPCVDHNHETDAVRSLLCSACNTAIGLLREDEARIQAISRYLQAN